MEQQSAIAITQDNAAKVITLTFPPESIPTDAEIEAMTINGILDRTTGGIRTVDVIRMLTEIVVSRYPESDEDVYALAPRQPRVHASIRNVPVEHTCEDPNCPHKSPVDPFETMLDAADRTHRELNLTKWEPFKYVALGISNAMWPALGAIIDMSQMRRHFNLLRVVSGFQIDTSKTMIWPVPLSYDVVEGIYFWNRIPTSFELQSNECPGPVLKPDRKYTFIGMHLKAPYSRSQIVFEKDTGVYEFGIFAWVCTCEQMYRELKGMETITSTFGEPSSKESIHAEYRSGISRWRK